MWIWRSKIVLALWLVALQLLPFAAHSANVATALSCCTKHFSEGDFNELNPGIGVEYGFNRFLTAGVMRDSDGNASYYAGVGARLSLHRYVHLGGFAGALHRADAGTIPAAAPALTIGTPRVAANVTYIPSIDGAQGGRDVPNLGFLQFRFGFGE